jgi:iron uptake system component EfeO
MVRSARLFPIPAALATVALVLAACGGGSGGSAAPPTALAPGVVAVEAKEYQFRPSTLTVPAGSVTFSVKNAGTEEHEFEIFEGETVVDEIEGLVPGLTKDLTVTLEAGAYTFACKLNGHDQLGMKGTLTVTGS